MRRTTERHSPETVRTPEERVIDCMHRYAYGLVAKFARPDARLLDVGFGEGYGSEIVVPHVHEYVGVDVERDAVEHAARRYADPRVSFRYYDGGVLPFDDEAFEIVVSFQVIEHVQDVTGLLREIRRVATPAATVLIVTPNRCHRLDDGERPWNRYHVREFTPSELRTVMAPIFPYVQVFGIHGSTAMEKIERERVARARRLARLDPLGLRYVLPEALDTRLRSLLRRRRSAEGTEGADDIDVAHVYHTAGGVDTGLDLLAVAGSGIA